MSNLWEYDGKKVASFRSADGSFIGRPNLVFKVEVENGDGALVNKYYVLLLDDAGMEIERWNYPHLMNVNWEPA
jgi:hypothetical protein